MSHSEDLQPHVVAYGVTPGSIVRCRNRDWVLLPSDSPDVHLLRPLTGATDEVIAVHKQLTDLIGYDLPEVLLDTICQRSGFAPPHFHCLP